MNEWEWVGGWVERSTDWVGGWVGGKRLLVDPPSKPQPTAQLPLRHTMGEWVGGHTWRAATNSPAGVGPRHRTRTPHRPPPLCREGGGECRPPTHPLLLLLLLLLCLLLSPTRSSIEAVSFWVGGRLGRRRVDL